MVHQSLCPNLKNTIDPENIVEKYGADSVRFFILADSPPERDVQWSDEGMLSSYKFIQKLWLLSENIFEISKLEVNKTNEELEIFTNMIIEKTNNALEKFRYNIIIAIYHEIYSFFKKIAMKNENYKNLKDNYMKILILMSPVIPHLANEVIEKFNSNKNIKWPEINKKYLVKEDNLVVIQVNGKKRSTVTIKEELEEKELVLLIKVRD